ncbi:MAG: peptide transporter ATP-binding protein [Devosia sp.]|nr:peptide transporter ATP-binding protein [Devosia sp.]
MVAQGQGYLATAWWLACFPGLAVMLTTMSFNLLANWFRIVVRHVSDRVMVMYLGKIIESGPTGNLQSRCPPHQALLSAVPTPDPPQRGKRKRILSRVTCPARAIPQAAAASTPDAGRPPTLACEAPELIACRNDPMLLTACHYAEPISAITD